MRWMLALPVMGLLMGCAESYTPSGPAEQSFRAFYQSFREDVAARGMNPDILDSAFGDRIEPYGVVLQHEKSQPEVTKTFEQYVAQMLSSTRREKGAALYREHEDALSRVEATTGVPAEVLVSLWGIESNFGANTGGHPVIPALVTLAWNSPRGEYFGKEAHAALTIAAQQRMNPRALTGSWAGAMGQCQFMPSNYLKYAVDGDGDGRADIWATPADVFASSGNFLKELGWQARKPWRMQARVTVRLPAEVEFNERGLSEPQTIAQWQKWGVVPVGARFADFGGTATTTRLYRPLAGDGPTYMLGPNYDVILKWNMSSYFATSVLLLAESIRNGGALPNV